MTLVGTVRKNKRFLPSNMQPTEEKPVCSTKFATIVMQQSVHMWQKKKKTVVLLPSMHMSGEVEESQSVKPEIIKYYNKTKDGVDTMDEM